MVQQLLTSFYCIFLMMSFIVLFGNLNCLYSSRWQFKWVQSYNLTTLELTGVFSSGHVVVIYLLIGFQTLVTKSRFLNEFITAALIAFV